MALCCFGVMTKRSYAVAVVITFAIDFIASCAAWWTSRHSDAEGRNSGTALADTIVCYFVRLVAFPMFTALAYAAHRRDASASPIVRLKKAEVAATAASTDRSRVSARAVMMAPLVEESNVGSSAEGSSAAAGGGPASTASSLSLGVDLERKQEHALCMKRAEQRRDLVMAFLFLLVTGMAMYSGFSCVSFHYDSGSIAWQGALLSSVVFFVNLEYFLLLDLLNKHTEDEGELVPAMHMHPLFLVTGRKCWGCDICHEMIEGPHYAAYHCKTCNFDLCLRCYRQKDKPTAKGYGARALRRDGEQFTTWTYFKRILQLALDFKAALASALTCLACTQALFIWAPHIQGSIFDGIIAALQQPGETSGRDAFQHACIVYLVVSASQGLFGGMKNLFQNLVIKQLDSSLRSKLFKSVMRMDIAFFDSMHTGQITSRLTNDISQMVQPLSMLMDNLVANLISLGGGMFMACWTSWKLSVLALSIVPPITYTCRNYGRWAGKMNRAIWCAYAEGNNIATQAISNIRTVRGFSTESIEADKFDDCMKTALKHGKICCYIGASTEAFNQYLTLGTSVLILWYGGTLVCDTQGKAMSLGNVMTFNLYWNMMNNAFISLGNVMNDFIRFSSAGERVCALMDAQPERDPDAGNLVLRDQVAGHLELRNVQFHYQLRPERQVLKGISLSMAPGSTTALVGKSGSGKSTLVHLLMRFYEPTEGSIVLDGEDMAALSSISVRQCCGFVSQETQLFATSVEENLAYGLGRPYTQEELVTACKAANALDFIMELEDQFQTRVGEKGVRLSGGQRQRLAIARCFLRRPRLLFLDEATSALDAENEGIVQEALEELVGQLRCTVVLIAHRLSTVIRADQIAVVHKGQIVELGAHQALVDQGGIYAQLVKRQMAQTTSTTAAADAGHASSKRASGGVQSEIDELIEEMESGGNLALAEVEGTGGD